MNSNNIRQGIEGEARSVVSNENTAVTYGSGSVSVYATPAMIGLMEKAALSSVDDLLDEGYSTVGIKMEIEHLAATPVGMNIIAKSKLVEVDGRRLVFDVEARDDKELIGKGKHERFIVPLEKFIKKAEEKTKE